MTKEPASASETNRVFRWLHISDIHFKEDETWDRRATLRALIAKVRELKDSGLAPNLVFVTGDIAFSGKAKEYEHATRFFHELNKVLELDPKDRWFLVPGNHDVDRSRITSAHRGIKAILTNEASVEEVLRDGGAMRLLAERLNEYYSFAAGFLGPTRAMQPDRPWRTDVRDLAGSSVAILQLNSAWVAEGGKADDANLLVGKAQLQWSIEETPAAVVRIALMHHPLRNLLDFDERSVKGLLSTSDSLTFLLRGHLHLNRTSFDQSPDGRLYELAAGALHTDDERSPRGFHLGEVDPGKLEARIHLFRFSDEGRAFFAPDNLTYENAPKGICKLKLPRSLRPEKSKAKNRALTEAQRLNLTARYRQAAAAYHGNARFIGFPNQATRPNARVSDLFVPLRMKPRMQGKPEGESISTAAIAERLLGSPQGRPARIVVLGDPGSGKTTLSRFLVMLAAGAITLPGVEVQGEPLPLRIAFRDFMEKRRSDDGLSLAGYLELQAKSEFSLDLPKTFLRGAMEQGRAVLFLDGLDEVGAPEQRATIRDLVAAFITVNRRVPVLVTTRIAGYDEASLSGHRFFAEGDDTDDFTYDVDAAVVAKGGYPRGRHLLLLFNELVLEKFDDDDLKTFVQHWYTVQEPSDPVVRDRGIADLLSALDADERVRELARTPILATLIAMIHRVEANLPGERAKLYELCVRMLLETWPAHATRRFGEIDAGLQRAYLESLAFDAQNRRDAYRRESVTFVRRDLIERLLPILRKRDFASEPEEKVRGIIERWIDHLEQGSGILVEQSAGVYAFFHLSIMEYLAALGMERELGREGAIATIVDRYREPAWREVCLLAAGWHAEDGGFLDALFSAIAGAKPVERWAFLLLCLREEARFRPAQRQEILVRCAESSLMYGPRFVGLAAFNEIRRFSIRHGEAVAQWVEDRLDHAVGDELAATAALMIDPDAHEVISRLSRRRDKAVAAGALLEFCLGSEFGAWAIEATDTASALAWSRLAPDDAAILRGVAGLALVAPAGAAFALALIERTIRGCTEGRRNILRVTALPRPGGKGLPAHITIQPGETTLVTATRAPMDREVDGTSPRFMRDFALAFALGFAFDFAHTLASDFDRNFAFSFARTGFNVTRDLVHDFARDFARDFAGDFARDFARHFRFDFARPVGSITFDVSSLEYADHFTIDVTATASDSDRISRESHSRSAKIVEAPQQRAILAAMTGEAWLALTTMAASEDEEECAAYCLFRLQNRWLFEVWSGIDARLPPDPTPTQLALYFALGWAQSTTTWAWPDSKRWRTLFDAGPGEHWLVRSQWHLCKLTENNRSEEDQVALSAALRDGRRDEELPGYAERLGEILGVE